jgi:peroxiredoxin
LFLFVLLLFPLSKASAKTAQELVGEETLLFTLPSTLDRTISYLNDYYGKYNLIITFFPAAFTPT